MTGRAIVARKGWGVRSQTSPALMHARATVIATLQLHEVGSVDNVEKQMVERAWSVFLSGIVVGAASLYLLNQANVALTKASSEDGTTAETTQAESNEPVADHASKHARNTTRISSAQASTSATTRPTLEDVLKQNDDRLEIQAIGVVRSVYRLCVGTPRQGLLAPHARGRLDLTAVPAEAVQGLEEYSHIWIFFIFHLNTLPKQGNKKAPMKIAPPILGGRKIGVLASRCKSPLSSRCI